MQENTPNQEIAEASKKYVNPAGVGVVLMLIILVMVFNKPCPSDSQYFVFRIVLAIAVAGFASILVGQMTLKYGKILEATGPIVVFFIIYLVNPPNPLNNDCKNSFTIYLEDNEGKYIAPKKDELILEVNNTPVSEYISAVIFPNIPTSVDSTFIKLNSEEWKFSNNSNRQKVKLEEITTLKVERNKNCCLEGKIFEDVNGTLMPLENVMVTISNRRVFTNSNGRFSIILPTSEQNEKGIRINLTKSGFRDKSKFINRFDTSLELLMTR